MNNQIFFNTLKNNKEKVQYLLKTFPKLRDNDSKLIANFWYFQTKDNFENMSARDFLQMFAENELVNPETIRRLRQKLQELDPELRGENYKRRHESAKYIKNNIKKL